MVRLELFVSHLTFAYDIYMYSLPTEIASHPDRKAFQAFFWKTGGVRSWCFPLHLEDGEKQYDLLIWIFGPLEESSFLSRVLRRPIVYGFISLVDRQRSEYHFEEIISPFAPFTQGKGEDGLPVRLGPLEAIHDGHTITLRIRTNRFLCTATLMPEKSLTTLSDEDMRARCSHLNQWSFYGRCDVTGFLTDRRTSISRLIVGVGLYEYWLSKTFPRNYANFFSMWAYVFMSDGREFVFSHGPWEDSHITIGLIIQKNGLARTFFGTDVSWHIDSWTKSSKSGASYPAQWMCEIPSASLCCVFQPVLSNQEMDGSKLLSLRAWGGISRCTVTIDGKSNECIAYVFAIGKQRFVVRLFFHLGSFIYWVRWHLKTKIR